jgi:uncharacterized protein (TIGR01777 family)
VKVVIAGGTGFLGHALVNEFLKRGDQIVVLSRSAKPIQNAKSVKWDGKTVGDWASHLEGAGAVLNVVGESVFTHWSDEKRKQILSSRVEPTRAIGQAIAKCENPPAAWVNASAVGYYGSVYEPTTEASPPGNDFLADVCKQWEGAQNEFELLLTNKSQVRIGFVLGRDGGAFPMLQKLTKFGLGSAQGDGKQWMGWIHIEDVTAIFALCVDKRRQGPVNATAPNPVTNAEFMAKLREAMHRPWAPNMPKIALKLGSLGPLPPTEVTLSSQRVLPQQVQQLGYQFKFTHLDDALKDLLRNG